MLLPGIAKSRHKVRDVQIIERFMTENETQETLAGHFHLSKRRIREIIYKNASVILSSGKDFRRVNRIKFLTEALHANPDLPIAKSKVDIIEALRKEEQENNVSFADNRAVFQVFLPGKEAISLNAQECQKPVDKPLDVVENTALSTNAVE